MMARLSGHAEPWFGTFAALILVLSPAPLSPATAQPQPVIDASAQRPLADVLEGVTPAVVNIAVKSGSSAETNPLYNDPFFRRYFNLPEMQERLSAGSGVIVDAKKATSLPIIMSWLPLAKSR
jgi:S1-C subfamily serine protease